MNAQHRNRKPTRLGGFDYSQNRAYFVTICTHERSAILADIRGGKVQLLPIGEICEKEIMRLPDRYSVKIDKYVIMPNHIHMILVLGDSINRYSLCDIICALKSLVSKTANQIEACIGRRLWQRSFHDHIIRDEKDYLKIWQYIDENPLRWELDCFYCSINQEVEPDRVLR